MTFEEQLFKCVNAKNSLFFSEMQFSQGHPQPKNLQLQSENQKKIIEQCCD